MAQPSKKGAVPRNFGSLTTNIIAGSTEPQQASVSAATPAKDKITSFELKGDLRLPLDRVIYGLGRKASLRSVLNAALAYYLENEPKAKRLAATPTPDEVD